MFKAEREAELDRLYMEDQRREWQLRDKKQRQQDDARRNLMRQVLDIRGNQIAQKDADREAQKQADKQERNSILAVSFDGFIKIL